MLAKELPKSGPRVSHMASGALLMSLLLCLPLPGEEGHAPGFSLLPQHCRILNKMVRLWKEEKTKSVIMSFSTSLGSMGHAGRDP